MSQITIIGLGPGSPDLLTVEAVKDLERAAPLYVSRKTPSVLSAVAERVTVVALRSTQASDDDEADQRSVVERVIDLARHGAVAYGSPGSPLTDDPISRSIRDAARRAGLSVRVVDGVSYLDFAVRLLDLDIFGDALQIVDSRRLASGVATTAGGRPGPVPRRLPRRRPDASGPGSRRVFPKRNRAATGSGDALPAGLSRRGRPPGRATVRVAGRRRAEGPCRERSCGKSSNAVSATDRAAVRCDCLRHVALHRRSAAGPGGCPWDREQTFESIKKHLLEETYEAVAALDEEAYGKFAEELGDVLLQVVMYAQFGREAERFDLEDVLRAVNEKLVRRHPHVFGDIAVGSSAEVLQNWERIKQAEKQGGGEAASTFAGIPQAAPALMRAEAVQSRASRHGWTPPAGPPGFAELSLSDLTPSERLDRLGDALFDLVVLARRYKLDPEEALRRATNRFVKRRESEQAPTQKH